jgi:hypothetical protein
VSVEIKKTVIHYGYNDNIFHSSKNIFLIIKTPLMKREIIIQACVRYIKSLIFCHVLLLKVPYTIFSYHYYLLLSSIIPYEWCTIPSPNSVSQQNSVTVSHSAFGVNWLPMFSLWHNFSHPQCFNYPKNECDRIQKLHTNILNNVY